MLKYLVPTIALLFATPTLADESCLTREHIYEVNPSDAKFVQLSAEQFQKVLNHFREIGSPAPDTVKSIMLGRLADNDKAVVVFAFNDKNCMLSDFAFSASAMAAILDGDDPLKNERDTGPHRKGQPVDNLCETRSEATLTLGGVRSFRCI